MDNTVTDIEGALTGALAALAANWVRSDNHNLRMLHGAKDNAHHAVSLVRDLANSGFFQRLSRPLVSDALGGLLLAEQQADQPSVTPNLRTLRRIELAEGMKSHIQGLHWPPREGKYDEQGLSIKAGDLVTLFLGMTYGESQSWNLGLLQEESPSREQRTQIYYAANALTKVLYDLDLSFDQFVTAWKNLFLGSSSGGGGGGGTTPAPIDPHGTTTAPVPPNPAAGMPPYISSQNPGLTSVLALGSEALGAGYSFVSQNSDRANKWRISVNGGVGATATIFQVNFGSPWTKNGMPYVPVVTAQGLAINAYNLTPSGFQVQSFISLNAGAVLDVGFTVTGA